MKLEKSQKRRQTKSHPTKNNQLSASQPSQSSQYSYDSQYSQATSQMSQLNFGAALLHDLASVNKESFERLNELPVLLDGGPDFDWYAYGLQCLGCNIPDNTNEWMENLAETCKRG